MTLPRAVTSERAFLGAILITPGILDRTTLTSDKFHDTINGEIYQAMRAIGSNDLDVVVLEELLERRNVNRPFGYVLGLLNDCPSSVNWQSYERIIIDTAIRRNVIQTAQNLATKAYDEESKVENAISQAINELVDFAKPEGGAEHIGKYLMELSDEVEKRIENPSFIYGLETGLSPFDKITRGLQTGETFILAGEPYTGKSLLAFQLACGMAENGHAGAVYEMEMGGVAVVRRKISYLSKTKTYELRSGHINGGNYQSYLRAIEAMENLPIYISDRSTWTTLQLRADLSRLKVQKNIQWFVIDYMNLLSDQYGGESYERTAFLSQQLHSIAKDLDLAALIIHSLTKAGYGRSPTMANLSGSNTVSYDADQIAILIDTPTDNVLDMTWIKNREGERGQKFQLYKVPDFPAFELYTKVEAEDLESNFFWNED